jgi:hypothetical protein
MARSSKASNRAWSGHDEALAASGFLPLVEAEMERHQVHPALLDACIQATIAIRRRMTIFIFRPGWNESAAIPSPAAAVWAYVRKTQAH